MFTSQMWKRNTEYLLIICISMIFTTTKVNSVVSYSTQNKLQVFFQQSLTKIGDLEVANLFNAFRNY